MKMTFTYVLLLEVGWHLNPGKVTLYLRSVETVRESAPSASKAVCSTSSGALKVHTLGDITPSTGAGYGVRTRDLLDGNQVL